MPLSDPGRDVIFCERCCQAPCLVPDPVLPEVEEVLRVLSRLPTGLVVNDNGSALIAYELLLDGDPVILVAAKQPTRYELHHPSQGGLSLRGRPFTSLADALHEHYLYVDECRDWQRRNGY